MRKTMALLLAVSMMALFTGCSKAAGNRQEKQDPDAPVSISSEIITSFKAEFYTAYLSDYSGSYDYCYMEMTREGDEAVCLWQGRAYGQSFDRKFTADGAALDQLQTIIKEADVISRNGFYGHTSGIPECGGSIAVIYDSKEQIKVEDNASVLFSDAVEPLCRLYEDLYAASSGDSLNDLVAFRFYQGGGETNQWHSYNAKIDFDGIKAEVGSPDGEFEIILDSSYWSQLIDMARYCRLDQWDGFTDANSDQVILDASSFSLEMSFADGRTMTAQASGSYPEGYNQAVIKIGDLFDLWQKVYTGIE